MCHKRFTLKHSMMRHRRKHDNANTDSPTVCSDDEDEIQPPENSGKLLFYLHLFSA